MILCSLSNRNIKIIWDKIAYNFRKKILFIFKLETNLVEVILTQYKIN